MTSTLENPVLVLNSSWLAIYAKTVREALTDVIGDKAKIVHPTSFVMYGIDDWIKQEEIDGQNYIQSARFKILVPEVIVSRYDKIPNQPVVFSRRNLWKRDGFCCQYCGIKPAPDEITIDHVVPRAIWNKQKHETSVTCFENCVLACASCNRKKDNRTPEQAGMKLRRMEMKDGHLQPAYYDRPKSPPWSPIYAVRKFNSFPKSWKQFLKNKNDSLYWNVELES